LPKTLAVAVALLAGAASAAERQVPFWDDAVPEALHAAVDGQAALETVRSLGRFHRVHGSPGFAAAAEFVRGRAVAAGLEDATIEHFPADGTTRYAHFRSYLGWNGREARLDEVEPVWQPLARFPELPVALADYSQDADVTARLVSVAAGTSARDYEGLVVAGKLVLASGALPLVHRLAVEERGALGFLSDYPNQTTAWSGDDRDLVRWGHLSPYQTKNTFAFMLSKRQADGLRARLAAGEAISLHAVVKARMVPASFDVVSATIRGTDPAAGEVVLTAHLCHQSSGANDNASGSAAILEVARALNEAIGSGALPRPRLTLRFLWTPEIAGSQAWLVRHPEIAARLVGGIHMDMVGGLLATTRGTFHLSRTAASLPHVLNDIGRPFFEQVTAASAHYAEHGGDPRAGFATPGGSREAFLGDIRPLELGSDHEVFEAAGFGVPMLYFHDWPDVTIHTNKDQPENLDATKLGRVAYLGAGIAYTLAALPDAEAARLLAVSRASAEQALARARLRAVLADDPRDGALAVREAFAEAAATLDSLARRWPTTAQAAREATAALGAAAPLPAAPGRDARVPVRSAEIRGPLDVYYYDHVAEALASRGERDALPADVTGFGGDPALMRYEALNLADGRRSVAEIRDVLSGRYEPLPLGVVGAYFDRLARAGVVDWMRQGGPVPSRRD
jgi:aminopeptidase YwaD